MANNLIKANRLKLLLTPFILVGITSIAIILSVIFQFRTLGDITAMPIERMFIGFTESLIVVFFYNFIIRKLNVRYPWRRSWFIRALIDFLIAISFPIIIISLINLALNEGWLPSHEHDDKFKILIFVMPLMISALLMVIVEMIVATEERNELELKLTQLEKEQLNAKYTALKEQLDHHFLFNNLSVLSSLIYESAEKADKFIQDFAAIYRYVLSINRQDLVTVKEELEFIKTYLNLYKCRFEDGFDYQCDIAEEIENYFIPPLTLQVVVENVFKHNVISKQRPLKMLIETEGNRLIIKNTLQSKQDKFDSTQTGQNNLVEKFKLLNCESPQFYSANDQYISQIPLIEPGHD